MRESERAKQRTERAEQRRERRVQRAAASERDLIRAYKNTQRLTTADEWEAERRRPGLLPVDAGYHPCENCKLAQIPNSKTAVLCQFCWRTKILERVT